MTSYADKWKKMQKRSSLLDLLLPSIGCFPDRMELVMEVQTKLRRLKQVNRICIKHLSLNN